MVIIAVYKLLRKGKDLLVIHNDASDPIICPECRGRLNYRDSRKRIWKHEGGVVERLIVRRLYCAACKRLHTELPDCVSPYKHYETATICGVIEGIVTAEDEDSESYPCEATMKRWHEWFRQNRTALQGHINRTCYELNFSSTNANRPLLEQIQEKYRNWLEIIIRIVYNSGGRIAPLQC